MASTLVEGNFPHPSCILKIGASLLGRRKDCHTRPKQVHHDNSDDDDDDDLFKRLAPEMVEDLVTLKCNLHLLREQPSV